MALRTFIASSLERMLALATCTSCRSKQADEQRTSLGSRSRAGDIQRPLLPAHLFVRFAEKVRLSAFLLEEAHCNLRASTLSMIPTMVRSLDSVNQLFCALVDQRLQVDIVDGWKGEVEEVVRQGDYGDEVAVEEDYVQYGCETVRVVFRSKSTLLRPAAGSDNAPLTTSLTEAGSANTSRVYSGA